MEPPEPADVLARWEAGGGSWRVVGRTSSGVTVELLGCDDEPMERVELSDPEVIGRLGARSSSEDTP